MKNNKDRRRYGGTIFTTDTGISCQMHAGPVMRNGGPARTNLAAAMAGYKRSGLGREYGVDGVLAFTEQKFIVFHIG